MLLNIPSELLSKLHEDSTGQLLDVVKTTLNAFENKLKSFKDEGMYFFPDFTDHGPNHIQVVLNLAEYLIADGTYQRPNSWKYITPEDAAVLIYAVLYHDIGMHLDSEGFLALISPYNLNKDLSFFDKQSWGDLWESYISELRHCNEKILQQIFGPFLLREGNRFKFKRPSNKPDDWDELDRRFIGEFIRRHHARLAHEVALYGWPSFSCSSNNAQFSIQVIECKKNIADLAGIVARSHSMPITNTFGYLKEKYSNFRIINEIHPIYLMAILRIADYLHFHADRASKNIKNLKKSISPFSKREILSHNAIEDVRLEVDPDPEAIIVDVSFSKLKDADIYFRIKDWWIGGLQKELDHSWAVLGQVYGRDSQLQKLWLQVRRVNTNLSYEQAVSQADFFPLKASFGTSDSDFLKLLISPLYGENPHIGIRELLQNSIDAIRELREYLFQKNGNWDAINKTILHKKYPDSDVAISLLKKSEYSLKLGDINPPAEWQYWVEVKDRGIGMSPIVIKEYFLKAGATFRRSAEWKKQFCNKNSKSKILRSGRFGIGALAAFLLGDTIQVFSRHFEENEGINLISNIDDEIINLKKAKCEHGTTVRVKCSEQMYNFLAERYWEWDWYYLVDPKIRRFINNRDLAQNKYHYKGNYVPCENSKLPPGWRLLKCPGFSEIHWSYSCDEKLLCNGIKVDVHKEDIKWKEEFSEIKDWEADSYRKNFFKSIIMPSVSVFDPDSNMNLNLARDGLTSASYPFATKLLEAVIRDIIAHSLVMGPIYPVNGSRLPSNMRISYPGLNLGRKISSTQWVYAKDGFTIADPHLVVTAGIKKVVSLIRRKNFRTLPSIKLDSDTAIIAFVNEADQNDIDETWEWPFIHKNTLNPNVPLNNNPLSIIKYQGCRALLTSTFINKLERKYNRIFREDCERFTEFCDGKIIIADGSWSLPPLENSSLNNLVDKSLVGGKYTKVGILQEWYIDTIPEKIKASLIANLWLKILGKALIPYDLKERRRQLSRAYETLSVNISAWEKVKKSELRKELNKKPKGSYPLFYHANEVKKFLVENRILRKLVVRKREWVYSTDHEIEFYVLVIYSQQEIEYLKKASSEAGVELMDNLEDVLTIKSLLEQTNAKYVSHVIDTEI